MIFPFAFLVFLVAGFFGVVWHLVRPSILAMAFVTFASVVAFGSAALWCFPLDAMLRGELFSATGASVLRKFGADVFLPGCISGALVAVAFLRSFLGSRNAP